MVAHGPPRVMLICLFASCFGNYSVVVKLDRILSYLPRPRKESTSLWHAIHDRCLAHERPQRILHRDQT